MGSASETRPVDTDEFMQRLLRSHLPVDALDVPAELVATTARDLILRDLERRDLEPGGAVAEPEVSREG